MAPHGPYSPKYEFRCKFNPSVCSKIDSKSYDDCEKERLEIYSELGMDNTMSQGCVEGTPVARDLDVYTSLYDGEIASEDVEIGRVLDTLKETGLDKNSIVVFYADHGEGFDHGYYFTHGAVSYKGHIRVPLIIKYPENMNDKQSDRFILNTDILPTLLEIMGIDYKDESADGISFADEFKSLPINLFKQKRNEAYMMSWDVFTLYIVIINQNDRFNDILLGLIAPVYKDDISVFIETAISCYFDIKLNSYISNLKTDILF